jgi:hypothetical protein
MDLYKQTRQRPFSPTGSFVFTTHTQTVIFLCVLASHGKLHELSVQSYALIWVFIFLMMTPACM